MLLLLPDVLDPSKSVLIDQQTTGQLNTALNARFSHMEQQCVLALQMKQLVK
jgi:hypothetical protein